MGKAFAVESMESELLIKRNVTSKHNLQSIYVKGYFAAVLVNIMFINVQNTLN